MNDEACKLHPYWNKSAFKRFSSTKAGRDRKHRKPGGLMGSLLSFGGWCWIQIGGAAAACWLWGLTHLPVGLECKPLIGVISKWGLFRISKKFPRMKLFEKFCLDPEQDIFVMVSRWYGGIHLGWCAEGWEFSLIETWSPWAEL